MPVWPHAGHYGSEALIDATTGDPIISGSYLVYMPDGVTLATIFTDTNRSNTQAQPLTTSSDGNASFYAEPLDGYILKAASSSDVIDVRPTIADLTTLLAAALTSTDNTFNGHVISGYKNAEVEYTGTTYNYVTATDLAATVKLSNASPISAPLPATTASGEGFVVVQKGAGQVTFSVSGTASLKNAHSHTKTFGQDAVVYLECTANSDGNSAVWRLSGDTAA